ncbi:hypothetical protein [Streptomyces spectabilis]|uniref:prenyltransferase/squalene oxidase repeat-containing protein n=1 Tax=Streptomyces spectabilis TaxID=68270 RepID=UPI003F4D2AC9
MFGDGEQGVGVRLYLTTVAPDTTLPDTVGVELLIPALQESLRSQLNSAVPSPSGVDPHLHRKIALRVCSLTAIPAKLLHSYEAIAAHCPPPGAPPADSGCLVGSSPAATAAWIVASGGPDCHPGLVRQLETATADHRGPVSCPTPITNFELLWVRYAQEIEGHLDRERTAAELTATLTPRGVHGAPGLSPDVDDTAVALYLLSRLGYQVDTQVLHRFADGGHYACYPGEDTPSTSANAHVLEALGSARDSFHTRAKISEWLTACQHPEGSWSDKWHASPYYAVYCCAPALHRYGTGAAAHTAVHRALTWLRATQRPDGSWGGWTSTAEETAYALLALARCDALQPREAARALPHLTSHGGSHSPSPLWHDKDLYCPVRVVHATIRAARRAAVGADG